MERKVYTSTKHPRYAANVIAQTRQITSEPIMARCSRCCLHKSIRIVNVITNLFAVGMIIYALWLQKKWNVGVAELTTSAYFPEPW